MRTYNWALKALSWMLIVSVLGVASTGCGDSIKLRGKGKKKGGAVTVVAPALDEKRNFGYTATYKAGVNEVVLDLRPAYFEANETAKAEGTESLLLGGDVTKAIPFTKLGNGVRRASKSMSVPNGWTISKLKNVKDSKLVVDSKGKDVGADISSSPDEEYRYSVNDSAYLWFIYNAKIYARSMEPVVVQQSNGSREFSLTIVDLSGDTPAGTVELLAVPGGDFTKAKKFEKQSDGRLKVTGIVINNDGVLDLMVGWFAGATLVQGFDLKVLSAAYDYNFDVKGSTLSFQFEGTDVYRVGTRETPWAPGNEGQGDLRFEVKTTTDASGAKVSAYRMFRKVDRLKDLEKQRYVGFQALPTPQPPEDLLAVDWYPGFVEMVAVRSVEWDKKFEARLYVANNFGTQALRLELPADSRYLKAGTTDTIQFTATSKGSIIPGTVPAGSEVSELLLGTPVNVPKQGRGSIKKTLFGKIGSYRVNLTENADVTYTAGSLDNQGNFVAATTGQEMFTATRGGAFEGKIDFGAQKCRIRYTYPNPNVNANNNTINVDLVVDVRVFDFVP